jgi:hypothetical protein
MTTTTLNFDLSVSLEEAVTLIATNPTVRFELVGEPGIGKSYTFNTLRKKFPDYYASFIDVPNMDLGDIAMPVIDHETRTTRYYPNARFGFHLNKPCIICMDEFPKGAQPVQNMLHPMLESSNARLGDVPVPEGSLIYMTGNLSGNGLGDNTKAHTNNRKVRLWVRKASAKNWLTDFAAPNNVSPVVMAWVDQFPHCMASYLDGNQDSNPYIFNPKFQQRAFVSGRSLERASGIVRNREGYSTNALTVALAGCVGEAAGKSIEAFVAYQDELPPREVILRDPKGAPLPTTPGACAVMVFSAIAALDKNNATPLMTYIQRLSLVWQACFTINAARDPIKRPIVCSNATFANWLRENQDLL